MQLGDRRARRTRQGRLRAAIALLLLCQLAPLAHTALSEHRVCLAHGGFVEDHDGSHAAEHARSPAAEGPVVGAAESGEDHAHCLSLGVLAATPDIGARAHALHDYAVTPVPQALARAAAESAAPLLRLAPKTSPPSLV